MLHLFFCFRSRNKLSYLFLASSLAVHSQQVFSSGTIADKIKLDINFLSSVPKDSIYVARNGGMISIKDVKNNLPGRIKINDKSSALLSGVDFSGRVKKLPGKENASFINVGNFSNLKIEDSTIQIKNDAMSVLHNLWSDSQVDVSNSSVVIEGKNAITFNIENWVNLSKSQVTARGDKSSVIVFSGRFTELNAEDSIITGDVRASGDSCNINCGYLFLTKKSLLAGSVNFVNQVSMNDSRWELSGDSDFNVLNMYGGSVIFNSDGFFKTLRLNELRGEGIIHMNTNLSEGKSDQLFVRGENAAVGSFQLLISDTGNEPENAVESQRLIFTQGGSVTFTLLGKHVDLGAYRYTLQRLGNDWQLTRGKVSKEAETKKTLSEGTVSVPVSNTSNSLVTVSEIPAVSSEKSFSKPPISAVATPSEQQGSTVTARVAASVITEPAGTIADQVQAASTPAISERSESAGLSVTESTGPTITATEVASVPVGVLAEQPVADTKSAMSERPVSAGVSGAALAGTTQPAVAVSGLIPATSAPVVSALPELAGITAPADVKAEPSSEVAEPAPALSGQSASAVTTTALALSEQPELSGAATGAAAGTAEPVVTVEVTTVPASIQFIPELSASAGASGAVLAGSAESAVEASLPLPATSAPAVSALPELAGMTTLSDVDTAAEESQMPASVAAATVAVEEPVVPAIIQAMPEQLAPAVSALPELAGVATLTDMDAAIEESETPAAVTRSVRSAASVAPADEKAERSSEVAEPVPALSGQSASAVTAAALSEQPELSVTATGAAAGSAEQSPATSAPAISERSQSAGAATATVAESAATAAEQPAGTPECNVFVNERCFRAQYLC